MKTLIISLAFLTTIARADAPIQDFKTVVCNARGPSEISQILIKRVGDPSTNSFPYLAKLASSVPALNGRILKLGDGGNGDDFALFDVNYISPHNFVFLDFFQGEGQDNGAQFVSQTHDGRYQCVFSF